MAPSGDGDRGGPVRHAVTSRVPGDDADWRRQSVACVSHDGPDLSGRIHNRGCSTQGRGRVTTHFAKGWPVAARTTSSAAVGTGFSDCPGGPAIAVALAGGEDDAP